MASVGVLAARGGSDDTYRHLAVFARVLHYVENNYVIPVEPRPLVYGAIRGMVASLDVHSTFMDPEQYAALQIETPGDFGRKSVEGRRLPDGTTVLRLRTFTERTFEDTRDQLATLSAERPIRGLVIDLRDNPGGLLDEAVRVADLWLERGVIVTTETRGRSPVVEMAHPRRTEPPYPIVILVNGGTASAAEILTGALQDHGRATVVGTQTFGKGSVQTMIELEDRSALRLTVAHYFTPQHRSIQGSGITPDQVVPPRGIDGDPAADPQLRAARQILARWARSR